MFQTSCYCHDVHVGGVHNNIMFLWEINVIVMQIFFILLLLQCARCKHIQLETNVYGYYY